MTMTERLPASSADVPAPDHPASDSTDRPAESPSPAPPLVPMVTPPPAVAKSQTEIELKLAIDDPAGFAALREALPVTARARGAASVKRLESVYFDTPGLDLYRAKTALRVRRVDGRFIQTLKAGEGTAPGELGRGEWEVEVPGEQPDPSAFGAQRAKALLDGISAKSLKPVFTSHIDRRAQLLEDSAGVGGPVSRIEIAFDEGEVVAEAARAPVREIELELVDGTPAALYRLALELHALVPLRIETETKAARGYALGAGTRPAARKAGKNEFDDRITVEGALATILRGCLAHWTANLPAALDGAEPEGVHQMRVALRRLRSALTMFGPVIAADRLEWLRSESGWLAGALGPARDLDVFLAETLAPVTAARPEDPALAVLEQAAETARERSYDVVREALRSPRTTALALTLGGWIEGAGWRDGSGGEHAGWLDRPMTDFARRVLTKRHRKALKRGHEFKRLTPPERHRVRIALKKLRYAAEFCHSLFPRKAARAYLDTMTDIQHDLGHLNDVAVAEKLLDDVIATAERSSGRSKGKGASLHRAAGTVIGWHARASLDLEAKVVADWRRFTEAEPFWRKPGD